MEASALARAFLAIAGVSVAIAARWPGAIVSFGAILLATLLVRQYGLIRRMLIVSLPLVAAATMLWLFVRADHVANLPHAARGLLGEDSPLLPLVRTLVGSFALVLAFGTAPDGQLFTLLRDLRIPRSGAALFASGRAVASEIPASYSRSLAALKAQGFVAPGAWSQLKAIGPVLSLTWVAMLSTSFARAEQKWVGNGFLRRLNPPAVGATGARARNSAVLVLTGAALLALLGSSP